MAELMPFTVELETLLQPISAREPTGEWLRYEGTYDVVQDARREEDESLPRGIWTSKVKRADWAKVAALCQKALRERTKDLQLAAWLAEAWLQLHGLPGFAAGLRLGAELLTRFWEGLYPLLDGEDAAYRLAPVEFLDRKVALRLKLLPIAQAATDEQLALSFTDWERALYNDKLQKDGAAEGVTPAQFLAAAAATPPQQFVALHADLVAVDEAALALEAAVITQTTEPSRVLRGLRALIADIMVLIAQYTPEVAPAVGASGAAAAAKSTPGAASRTGELGAPAESHSVPTSPHAAGVGDAGPIHSRTEAFRRLTEAAEFLLRTEPHSPVPYLVQRAITWGNMSLGQLLIELVNGEADRRAIYTLLGIPAPP